MSQQTNRNEEMVEATIFRFPDQKWLLVSFQKTKNITRKEGLELKNKYGMKPYNANGFSMGYNGFVPVSIFEVEN